MAGTTWPKLQHGVRAAGSEGRIAMRRLSIIAAALVIGLSVLGGASMAHGQPDEGWITLIEGTAGLENWDRIGDANWRAEDGAIVADAGTGGFLVSKDSYADFQLRAEFWADETTNSGIYIRCSDPNEITASTSYEVNIYDQRPDPTYGTGAIVNVAAVAPMPTAGGKWNTYEITAQGAQLTVVLNGAETASGQDGQFAQGPIALQYGSGPNNAPGGAIKWRRVQIKPL
jgi:hypothetical protein